MTEIGLIRYTSGDWTPGNSYVRVRIEADELEDPQDLYLSIALSDVGAFVTPLLTLSGKAGNRGATRRGGGEAVSATPGFRGAGSDQDRRNHSAAGHRPDDIGLFDANETSRREHRLTSFSVAFPRPATVRTSVQHSTACLSRNGAGSEGLSDCDGQKTSFVRS